jgi:hypothetical protein
VTRGAGEGGCLSIRRSSTAIALDSPAGMIEKSLQARCVRCSRTIIAARRLDPAGITVCCHDSFDIAAQHIIYPAAT